MALFSLLLISAAAPAALGRRRALITSTERPVEKVIGLLSGLKQKVVFEGETEASNYDEFACFCKDTTKTKSDAIKKGKRDIDSLSATIAKKTAEKEDKMAKLKKRQQKQEETQATLQATMERCAAEKAEYEATNADLSSAIYGLEHAKGSLEAAKPNTAAFVQVQSTLDRSMAVASKMGLEVSPKGAAAGALLQQHASVDPSDPMFAYHSQGIIDTIDKLYKIFTGKKEEVDAEWSKASKICSATQISLRGELLANKNAMEGLSGDIVQLKTDTASARESLLNDQSGLKDDEQYMQQLTERCEARANDWDQRSELRKDELEALGKALDLLQNNVSSMDKAANQRVERSSGQWKEVAEKHRKRMGEGKEESEDEIPPVFLQESAITAGQAHGSSSAVSKGAAATDAAAAAKARQEKAMTVLRDAASKAGSTALSALAVHVASNPFTKVKKLIQDLVERLLAEANAEVTKKSFCDEELAKSRQARDYRLAEARKLSTELEGLESKHDSLVAEIDELSAAIKQGREDLSETAKMRQAEKEANLATMRDAKSGLKAITEALDILKIFYTKASRARVLLQASPVDEDTSGPGFKGAYKGAQVSKRGVIGLLEVIKSDFERTLRKTEAEEDKAREEFVEFERAMLSDISGKETKKDLDTEDLKTNKATTEQKMNELQTTTNLIDAALKSIEALKPTCIDTGMSYKDRVSKREEEIAALKKALCILDPEGVEERCNFIEMIPEM